MTTAIQTICPTHSHSGATTHTTTSKVNFASSPCNMLNNASDITQKRWVEDVGGTSLFNVNK